MPRTKAGRGGAVVTLYRVRYRGHDDQRILSVEIWANDEQHAVRRYYQLRFTGLVVSARAVDGDAPPRYTVYYDEYRRTCDDIGEALMVYHAAELWAASVAIIDNHGGRALARVPLPAQQTRLPAEPERTPDG